MEHVILKRRFALLCLVVFCLAFTACGGTEVDLDLIPALDAAPFTVNFPQAKLKDAAGQEPGRDGGAPQLYAIRYYGETDGDDFPHGTGYAEFTMIETGQPCIYWGHWEHGYRHGEGTTVLYRDATKSVIEYYYRGVYDMDNIQSGYEIDGNNSDGSVTLTVFPDNADAGSILFYHNDTKYQYNNFAATDNYDGFVLVRFDEVSWSYEAGGMTTAAGTPNVLDGAYLYVDHEADELSYSAGLFDEAESYIIEGSGVDSDAAVSAGDYIEFADGDEVETRPAEPAELKVVQDFKAESESKIEEVQKLVDQYQLKKFIEQ